MKNIEALEIYNGYKVFLDQLAQNVLTKEEKEEDERQKAKKEKLEEQKRKTGEKFKQQKAQQ